MLNHHMCSLMMTASEAHFWFNKNVKFSVCFWVKRGTNVTISLHVDRFKILFPFFVPINLVYLLESIVNFKFIRLQNVDTLKNRFVPQILLHEGGNTRFGFGKTFECFFAQFGN